MKKTLTLSIIIPVYNEEDYIKDCLDSIAKQTVKPDEVLVIDNNSTDKTVKLAKKYSFVRVINEPKQGVLHARTTGFNKAKSDILGRIDADTNLEADWVEQLHRIFEGTNTSAVTGSSHWYDMPLSPWNHKLEDIFKSNLYNYEKNFPFLFGTNMAVLKSAWDDVKNDLCQDDYIFEDSDLAIHLSQSGHSILYDKDLRAGMSARRSKDSLPAFKKYINLQSLTYRQHGIKTVGSAVSIVAYTLGYLIVRPLYLAYDQKTKKRSLKHFILGKKEAREHPFQS